MPVSCSNSVAVLPITRSFPKEEIGYLFEGTPQASLKRPPLPPAAMDDDSEVIYSTPLPGASSTPHHAAAPPPLPHLILHPPPPPPPPAEKKPADYVYYERRPDDLSSDARARATATKVKLQSHYRLALETAIDLNVRCVCIIARALGFAESCRCRGAELERALAGVQEDRRTREIRRHTRTQSQFLRLRRTKIGLRDFRTVKVIGKGAFGEVCAIFLRVGDHRSTLSDMPFCRFAWCKKSIRDACTR